MRSNRILPDARTAGMELRTRRRSEKDKKEDHGSTLVIRNLDDRARIPIPDGD